MSLQSITIPHLTVSQTQPGQAIPTVIHYKCERIINFYHLFSEEFGLHKNATFLEFQNYNRFVWIKYQHKHFGTEPCFTSVTYKPV